MRTRHPAVSPAYAVLLSAPVMGVIGALGHRAGLAWLFPRLDPTIFLQAVTPHEPAARPWNTLAGHAIGVVVGFAAVFLLGAEHAPPVLSTDVLSASRVAAKAIAVGATVAFLMATQLPASLVAFRLTPGAVLIALIRGVGIWLISRASKRLPWHASAGDAPDMQEKPKGHSQAAKAEGSGGPHVSTARAGIVFGVAALVTLIAGVVLERSGGAIAGHIGMSGVLFGATVLAAATSLPEVSTGLASMRLKDCQLAVSDIFGGNASCPCSSCWRHSSPVRPCCRTHRGPTSTSRLSAPC